MPTDPNELAREMREAAERARDGCAAYYPGAWAPSPEEAETYHIRHGENGYSLAMMMWPTHDAEHEDEAVSATLDVARHIAAANPGNVLAILDDRDKWEALAAEARFFLSYARSLPMVSQSAKEDINDWLTRTAPKEQP